MDTKPQYGLKQLKHLKIFNNYVTEIFNFRCNCIWNLQKEFTGNSN